MYRERSKNIREKYAENRNLTIASRIRGFCVNTVIPRFRTLHDSIYWRQNEQVLSCKLVRPIELFLLTLGHAFNGVTN
jgi:hypothetical protein